VGQLKLGISVEFIGNLKPYQVSEIGYPTPPPKSQTETVKFKRYASHVNSSENQCRKNLMKEMDFYAESGDNSSNAALGKSVSKPVYLPPSGSTNKALEILRTEKKNKRNISVFDVRSENMTPFNPKDKAKDWSSSIKKSIMKGDHSLQYLAL